MNDEDIQSGTSCTGATPYKYLWNTVIVRTQTVDAVIVGRGTSMHAILWLKNQSCSSMFRKLSEACSRCWVPVSTSFHGHFEWTAWGRARDARCARALVRLKTFGVRIRRFFSFFFERRRQAVSEYLVNRVVLHTAACIPLILGGRLLAYWDLETSRKPCLFEQIS